MWWLDIFKTFYARSNDFKKSYDFAKDITTSSITSAVGAKQFRFSGIEFIFLGVVCPPVMGP